MALSLKQTKTGLNTAFASDVSSTAFASPLTNPSIILVTWEGDVVAQDGASTPTDTAGNTYIKLLSKAVAATFDLEIWYAINTKTTASNAVRITDNGGGVDSIIIAEEWIGTKGAPTDGSNSNTGLGTSMTSGAFTTSFANDLLWVGGCSALGSGALSAGAGFSNLTQANTSFTDLGCESQVVTAAGSQNAAMTTTSASWACGMGGFKALSGIEGFLGSLGAGG